MDAGVLYLGDAVGALGDAEAEEGAIGLPGDAEVEGDEVEKGVEIEKDAQIEEDTAGFPEDAEAEAAEAEAAVTVHSEASAVETLVVVEATQVFELAFGSPACSRDLDSAFSREAPYSMPVQERESLLEISLETDGVADCWRAGDWLGYDAEARLLRVGFGLAQ